MTQWIAIAVVTVILVCLSGSSVSRKLVRIEEEDYRWKADFSENSDENTGSAKINKYDHVPGFWETGDDYNDSGHGRENAHDVHHFINHTRNTERKEHNFGYDHVFYGNDSGDYEYNEHGGFHTYNSETEYSGQNGQYGSHGRENINHNHKSKSSVHEEPKNFVHIIIKASRSLPQNHLKPPERTPTLPSDADRIVFPDSYKSPQTIQPTTTVVKPTRTTTDRTLRRQILCLRDCPTTSEYNPVCGTDNITYHNPAALQCAQKCGLNVTVASQEPCWRVVPLNVQLNNIRRIANKTTRPVTRQTTSTSRTSTTSTTRPTPVTIDDLDSLRLLPTMHTHYANVSSYLSDSTLIPLHILDIVFGKAHLTKNITDEAEFDIIERMNL